MRIHPAVTALALAAAVCGAPVRPAAAATAKPAPCPQAGLKLPAGFCATVFADGDGSYAGITRVITQGVPQPKQYRSPMPPLGGSQLTPEQTAAVAAYIWALSHR